MSEWNFIMDENKLNLVEIQKNIGNKIKIINVRSHNKASEVYADVIFIYDDEKWDGAVPIVYRRTGVDASTPEKAADMIKSAYKSMIPSTRVVWLKEQEKFWNDEKAGAVVTRPFFEKLSDFKWKCVAHQLPTNPNWARRIQDIKDMGYTLANRRTKCITCGKSTTQVLLVSLPRNAETGYETWSAKLWSRIITVLGKLDAYENTCRDSLLPDHKFPEIRWDEKTKQDNDDGMTDEEIKGKFQLLSNQRNQQKREVCRKCHQTGKRGKPFGINFFYDGGENWSKKIPVRGSKAEAGCVGCGWYDIAKWREELNKKLSK